MVSSVATCCVQPSYGARPTMNFQWGWLKFFCVFRPWWPWPLTFKLGRDFCTMYLTAKFDRPTFSCSEVIVRTNKQTPLKTSTALRYATWWIITVTANQETDQPSSKAKHCQQQVMCYQMKLTTKNFIFINNHSLIIVNPCSCASFTIKNTWKVRQNRDGTVSLRTTFADVEKISEKPITTACCTQLSMTGGKSVGSSDDAATGRRITWCAGRRRRCLASRRRWSAPRPSTPRSETSSSEQSWTRRTEVASWQACSHGF